MSELPRKNTIRWAASMRPDKRLRVSQAAKDLLSADIQAWAQFLLGTGEFPRRPRVGLCRRFMDMGEELTSLRCGACPVARDGHAMCEGTPYPNASAAEQSLSGAETHRLAREMLTYLSRLNCRCAVTNK